MTIEQPLKGEKFGPVLVSLANAARAFDAPVRYPVLFRAPFLWTQGFQGIMAFPRMSSFVTLIEHFFGLIILFTILFFTRGFGKLKEAVKSFTKLEWIAVIFISFGGSALGLFFFLISFALGNPTVAILLQKSQPIITVIFAFFILKERPKKLFWGALALSLVGIVLIITPDIIIRTSLIDIGITANIATILAVPSLETVSAYAGLIAILCSLIAATLWGGSTVFGRILTKKVNYWDLTLLRYFGGFVFLVIFNIILFTYNKDYFGMLGQPVGVFGPWNWQWPMIVCIIFTTIFTGGVLPLALYYFGLKRSKAYIAGLAELAFPLLAILVNYLFLGATLTWFQGSGAIILLITVSTLSFINAKDMAKKTNSLKSK
ncbi:MAG: DMT family transporter [Candidatus Heimdallarchaeaceae archaeon]